MGALDRNELRTALEEMRASVAASNAVLAQVFGANQKVMDLAGWIWEQVYDEPAPEYRLKVVATKQGEPDEKPRTRQLPLVNTVRGGKETKNTDAADAASQTQKAG